MICFLCLIFLLFSIFKVSSPSSAVQTHFYMEASDVLLNCSTSDTNEGMVLGHDGKLFFVSDILNVENVELISTNVFRLKKVTIDSAGDYTCEINGVTYFQFHIVVIVASSPTCTPLGPDLNVIGTNDCQDVTTTVQYKCMFKYRGDFKMPIVTWFDVKNNSLIPNFSTDERVEDNNSNIKTLTSSFNSEIHSIESTIYDCILGDLVLCRTKPLNVNYVLRSDEIIRVEDKNDSTREIKCVARSNVQCTYEWMVGDEIIFYGQSINAKSIILSLSPSSLSPVSISSSSSSSLLSSSSSSSSSPSTPLSVVSLNVSCRATCMLLNKPCNVDVMKVLISVDRDDVIGGRGSTEDPGVLKEDYEPPFSYLYIIIGIILSMFLILVLFVVFLLTIFPGLRRIKSYFKKEKKEALVPIDGVCLHSGFTVDVPTDASLPEFMFKCMQPYLDRTAFIDPVTQKSLTYREVKDKIILLSSALWYDFGIRPGDNVGLVAPNTIQYPILFYAIIRCGAVCVPISYQSTRYELLNYVEDSRVLYIITVTELKEKFAYVRESATFIDKIILLEGDGSQFPSLECYFSDVQLANGDASEGQRLLISTKNRDVPKMNVDPNDTVVISYSSGTTGIPKGCMHTHKAYIANLVQMSHPDVEMFQPGKDVTIATLTMSHMYAQDVYFLSGMGMGCTMVILKVFNLYNYLSLAQDYQATCLHLVPSYLLELVSTTTIDGFDLSHLRKIETKAAPLTEEMLDFFKRKLPNCRLLRGYGMTEAMCITKERPLLILDGGGGDDDSGAASLPAPPSSSSPLSSSSSFLSPSSSPPTMYSTLRSNKVSSVGKLIPGVCAKVLHLETNECLGANQKGELCFKSPALLKGYWNKPYMKLFDEDGFIRTGDVGYFDDNKEFYVIDRTKDLIKCEGEQVCPLELERILSQHPRVQEAAVVGVKNSTGVEVPRAFVVKSGDVHEYDLISYVNQFVAPHKRLQGGVVFINKIPKLGSGKVLKSKLRELEPSIV